MERIDLEFLFGLRAKAKAGVDGMLFLLNFCMNIGLISSEYVCPICKSCMKLTKQPQVCDSFEWVCRTTKTPSHNVRRSVRNDSWFAGSRLSICDILLMTEFFVRERSLKDVRHELRLAEDTVCEWRSYFREVCVAIFSSDTDMIGGVGKIVEIVESKCDKRKYKKGKHMDGKWVFAGVERGSNKCFLRVVEKRDKVTLLNVIKSTILPGTTILSDCWKSYDILKDEGFQYLTVHHSLFFKNLETGVCTNSFEGTWSAVKRSIPSPAVTDQFVAYLSEYLWRRHHSGDDDMMATFLEGLRRVYRPRAGILPRTVPWMSRTSQCPAPAMIEGPENSNDEESSQILPSHEIILSEDSAYYENIGAKDTIDPLDTNCKLEDDSDKYCKDSVEIKTELDLTVDVKNEIMDDEIESSLNEFDQPYLELEIKQEDIEIKEEYISDDESRYYLSSCDIEVKHDSEEDLSSLQMTESSSSVKPSGTIQIPLVDHSQPISVYLNKNNQPNLTQEESQSFGLSTRKRKIQLNNRDMNRQNLAPANKKKCIQLSINNSRIAESAAVSSGDTLSTSTSIHKEIMLSSTNKKLLKRKGKERKVTL